MRQVEGELVERDMTIKPLPRSNSYAFKRKFLPVKKEPSDNPETRLCPFKQKVKKPPVNSSKPQKPKPLTKVLRNVKITVSVSSINPERSRPRPSIRKVELTSEIRKISGISEDYSTYKQRAITHYPDVPVCEVPIDIDSTRPVACFYPINDIQRNDFVVILPDYLPVKDFDSESLRPSNDTRHVKETSCVLHGNGQVMLEFGSSVSVELQPMNTVVESSDIANVVFKGKEADISKFGTMGCLFMAIPFVPDVDDL